MRLVRVLCVMVGIMGTAFTQMYALEHRAIPTVESSAQEEDACPICTDVLIPQDTVKL